MLIAFSGVGLPSSVTVPVTDPVVEASTVFPAAGLAGCVRDSLLSLLPQPVMASATTAARARLKYHSHIEKFLLMFGAYCNDFVYDFVRFLITAQLPGTAAPKTTADSA